MQPHRNQTPDAMAAMRAQAYGSFPCPNGCGTLAKTKAGLSSHQRNCKAGGR